MTFENIEFREPLVYAVKHKNMDVRMNSRSGGFFTSISDLFINDGGVVYGCVLDNNLDAVHMRATTQFERDRMMGSKYIQSNIGDMFKKVRYDLDSGKRVLFTGTSCQVAGLLNYIGDDNSKLFCVDIVCHGVPSPKVFHNYIQWQEINMKSKCIGFDFRNKKEFGWNTHIETLNFANGSKVNSEIFKNLFYAHQCIRPSCYSCAYKSILHPGDITIADYWGIDKAAPGFDDNKGVSLVLVNNRTAERLFHSLTDIEVRKCRIEDSMQPPLEAPFPEPVNRSEFWDDLNCRDFGYVAAKYGNNDAIHKAKHMIKKLLRKSLY
ncbi:Coenzyme F420 hydrogenase/dehydrogenase, beta subunit C-terminal domain [Butyrivibrio sp. LC3010]|uniref:Coenzyme F420 hydrogenase/dehydrogenase, beta subunit C-terminal domain n=1 Tax=Butyrivibrio sp. LC3010 TaxID=1280680 RepID=UPI00040E0C60|nr:Coenzyme F420 hydrogenase/dehydrogenase, beta subunit C-terminal domain [Butyrivibrio sp. LC3010]